MEELIVCGIQSKLYWEDKEENLKLFAKHIESINFPCDIIVLPEMFTTGFSMNAELLAEKMDGKSVAWMRDVAMNKKVCITGSLIIEEEGKYYNRLVWIDGDGDVKYYNKRHLFSMGEEHQHFTSGNQKLIVEYKSWKINLAICYDLRFPVWLRNSKENPYDLLIIVANWPEKRIEHWDALLKARAIENQAYVIGINRTEEDGNGINHVGHTCSYDAYGTQISYSEKEEVIKTVLKRHDLTKIRRQYPFLKDMD